MARPPDLNPPLLLAHAILCLVLCGATIGTQSLAQQSTDGPVSVNLGDVFRKDSVKIEDASLTSLPPLPQGYAALNNKAYRITTDAEAVGPYKVTFKASSIAVFRNLRMFHAGSDNSYTIKIPSLVTTDYSIEAVAADNAGLPSKSLALRLGLTTI